MMKNVDLSVYRAWVESEGRLDELFNKRLRLDELVVLEHLQERDKKLAARSWVNSGDEYPGCAIEYLILATDALQPTVWRSIERAKAYGHINYGGEVTDRGRAHLVWLREQAAKEAVQFKDILSGAVEARGWQEVDVRNREIARQVKSGRSYGDVGRSFGLSSWQVSCISRPLGAVSKHRVDPASSKVLKARNKKIVRRLTSGYTLQVIADECGLSRERVRQIAARAGAYSMRSNGAPS